MRRKSQRKRVINAASQRASQAEPKMKAEQSSDTKHEYNSERTSKHLRAIRSSESRKKEKRIRHPKYIVSNGAKHYVLCTPRVTDSNGNTVHTVMDTRDYKVVKVRKVEDLGVFVLDDDGKKGTYDQGEIDNDGHIDICIESPVNENGDTVHSFVDDDGFQVNGLKKVDALGTYTLDDLVNANSANNKLIRETPTDIVVDENASDEEHSEIGIDDEKESDTSKNGVNEKGHQTDGNNAESNDSPSIEVLENHDQMVEKGLNSGKGENVRERYSEEDDFFEDDHLGDDHEEANKESDKNTITKGDVEVLESSDSEVRSEPKETTKKPCKNEMRSELKGSTKKPCKPKKGRREDEGEKEKILKNEEGINGKKKDKCKRGKHRNRCIKKNETLNKTTKSDEKGEDERGGMDTDGERDVRKELSDENERKKSPKPKEIVESSHTYTDVPDITEHFSSVSTERENIRATDSETKKKKHKKCKTSTSTTSKPHCRPHKRHREHNASDMKDSTTRHGLERLKDSPVLYDSDENLKLTRLRDEESADDDNGVDDDEINEDKSNRSDINKNNRNNDNEDAINSEDDDNDVSDSAGKTIQSDRILRLDLAKARQYGLISVPQRIGTAYSAPLSVADIGPNGFRI
ncbi:hypothetical protein AB6A40_004763 [Gnathostoma spinigerum]|uniref:Uncharacterized protein n=1 Tax=Gnathostoma spinigerum TaxID=75299 RepID=A0ABD6EIS4_9BILA